MQHPRKPANPDSISPPYQSYADEPPDVFQPMEAQQESYFYGLETDSITEDFSFYDSRLPESGLVLELGCGTGRLTNRLTTVHRHLLGLDISLHMVQRARSEANPFCHYVCMDMLQSGLRAHFASVIIPRNTLNLMQDRDKILQCLQLARSVLSKPHHKLLLQVWVPTAKSFTGDGRSFQFQLLDYPPGGVVVKETLRRLEHGSCTMEIEERFRLRPHQGKGERGDFHTIFSICAFPATVWLDLFKEADFVIDELFGGFDNEPFNEFSNILLASLLPSI